MERTSLTIDIKVNEIGSKPINVRSNLLVANLIAAVKDKFNLDGNYELRLSEARRPLREAVPLDTAGVAEGSVLVFSSVVEASGTRDALLLGVRYGFSRQFRRVYLVEERRLAEFELAWQPAVLGRENRRDPSQNKLLAVALDDVEEATTVSHHHACITEADGGFFVEAVNDYNPTYLDNERLRPWRKSPLPAGARIQVGRVALNFYVVA
jgi:FHA domain